MSYPAHPIPPAPGQLASVAGMTPEQVEQARAAGQLQWLLSGQNPPAIPPTGQLGDEHLKAMSPEQIVEAHEQGRFSTLLGPTAAG